MKANEIRIGNLVNYWKQNQMVSVTGVLRESLCADGYCHGKGALSIFQFKPILLTEYWLLNFGFVLTPNFEYKIFASEDGLVTLCLNSYDEKLSELCVCIEQDLEEEDKSHANIFLNNIKFVHELQNLYFTLRGEELILKE